MAPTVLLVDDDPDLLEVMGLLVDHQGLGYLAARSLAEVQAVGAELGALSLAILDVNLGVGQPTGVEVCTWLRDQGVACPIVFLTGHAPDHPLVREAAGTEHRVLAKPLATRTLQDLLRGLP